MLTLYDYLSSGNGYKCRLLLNQLGIPYHRVELDIMKGETRTPEFLAKNPNGRIPALELEDGSVLAESNAILFYLAEGTPFLPADRLGRAQVLQWLFFEQLPRLEQGGYAALGVMESRLADHPFLVADGYTIADIALYAYTHVADEGGFDLEDYPGLRAWLARVAGQPQHLRITAG